MILIRTSGKMDFTDLPPFIALTEGIGSAGEYLVSPLEANSGSTSCRSYQWRIDSPGSLLDISYTRQKISAQFIRILRQSLNHKKIGSQASQWEY